MLRDVIARARAEGRSALDEVACKLLLADLGIRVPRSVVVAEAAEAVSATNGLRPPFAVKVVSPAILHKSDVGGVTLNMMDGTAVTRAIEQMAQKPGIADKPIAGWLVEEMIPPGREMVIGGIYDPQFGPMIMVGLGGIFVEALKDIAFRVAPLSRQKLTT